MAQHEVEQPSDQSTDNKRKKRVGYGAVAAVAVTVFAYFYSQVFASILIVIGARLLNVSPDQALTDLQNSTLWQFLYMLLVQSIIVGLLWLFLKYRKVPLSVIGLGRGPRRSDIGPSLMVFGAYFLTLIVLTAIVSQLVPSINLEQEQQLGFETVRNNVDLLMVFISLVILPPLVEEILVRGFMYTGLRQRFSKVRAALIASVIFGVAHLQLGAGAPPLWIAAIDTALLSLFLIYLRERTGSLWAPIFVHAIKNGLAFMLLFVFVVR